MNILFQPITIGKMKIKNRFVRSATHDWLGNPNGTISDAEITLYRTLAENEVGLIISAMSNVSHPLGKGSANQNALYDDMFIKGYQEIVKAIRPWGTRFIIQLAHAGRQTGPSIIEGNIPLAPSAVSINEKRRPREMTEAEILAVIDDFISAIVRAEATGCDGIQLHIAHGYLLSQFISPYTNRRQDKWGGSVENRARIIREIVTGAKKRVSPDFPLLVKLNSTDGITGPEYLTRENFIFLAKMLEDLGIAAIEVSGGIGEVINSSSPVNIKETAQEACFLEAARAAKEHVSIPIILVGGLRSYQVMEGIVARGDADLVALSRPFIKEPDLIKKLSSSNGKADCVSCNACYNPKGAFCYYKGGD